MFSHPVRVGAPAVGFILGLVVTYGFADAGPGPVSSRILRDAVLQSSVGSEIRIGDESLASFDERFAIGKVKKESLASYPHFASLEMGPGAGDTYRAGLRFYAFVRHAPTRARQIHSPSVLPAQRWLTLRLLPRRPNLHGSFNSSETTRRQPPYRVSAKCRTSTRRYWGSTSQW